MTYEDKYDNMPLRGKTTFYGWMRHHNRKGWFDDSRKHWRKHHRHYDLYKEWRDNWTSGAAWKWLGNNPSKGHKRKTWKDYN